MLQSMRSGAKSPIMKAFLIFLAGGFALWGIGDITSGSFGSDKAVEAGDKSYSTQEAAVEFDRARRNLGVGLTIGEALQTPLLNEVMGSLGRKVLFSAEADRLGLTVTRTMQTEAIREERAFKDEFGDFAEGRFLQTLSQIGLSEQEYLTRLTETLERDQIIGAVAAGAVYPKAASDTLAKFQLEERAISYIGFAVSPDAIADPTDGELSAWYDENQASYDAPILRQFDAIILDPAMLEASITITDDAVAEAFDLRRDEFITPETRQLSQMVFETVDEATAALSDIQEGGAFQDVAQSRLNWTQDDTNLGTLTRDAFDPALADVAFAGAQGDVVGPVETAFGFHLIQIEAINAGGEATLDDVRDQLVARLKAEQALDLVYERANELEDILGSGSSLQDAASAISMSVTSLPAVDVNGFDIDGQSSDSTITSDSNFLSLGWELEEGDISVLGETGEATFFVVELVSETDATSRPLADVKDRAVADYKLAKAVEAAKREADSSVGDTAAFSTASDATIKRTGAGLDHPAASLIAQKAFELPADGVGIVETGDEAILVRTNEILAADSELVRAQSEQISLTLAQTVRTDWTAALALTLSEDFDLSLNQEAVRLLLVQAAQ
ncbi:MAG: peptidyl-prolyl cis-trans isomerase [Candidatus Puniceispirillaceae bacterium]